MRLLYNLTDVCHCLWMMQCSIAMLGDSLGVVGPALCCQILHLFSTVKETELETRLWFSIVRSVNLLPLFLPSSSEIKMQP